MRSYRSTRHAQPLLVRRLPALVETVALASWFGALVGFVAFTPQAIRLIPIGAFAAFIGADLRFLTVLGTICGGIALICAIVGTRDADDRRNDLLRMLFIALAIALGFWGSSIVAHMEALAAGQTIASLPKTAPERMAYGALHTTSTRVYGASLLFVLVALVTLTLRERPES